jgi:hypothetical protein
LFSRAYHIIGEGKRIRGARMPDMIFIVLTVVIFALLGLVVKAVERL